MRILVKDSTKETRNGKETPIVCAYEVWFVSSADYIEWGADELECSHDYKKYGFVGFDTPRHVVFTSAGGEETGYVIVGNTEEAERIVSELVLNGYYDATSYVTLLNPDESDAEYIRQLPGARTDG